MSGEYAVVFGEPGIAIPAPIGIRATFVEDTKSDHLDIKWQGIVGNDAWIEYLRKIIALAEQGRSPFRGTLTIVNELPLQKGMGSSTALVIAVARCLLGQGKEAEAHAIEDAVNPGNSGIDFAVIWNDAPLLFRRGHPPTPITLPKNFLAEALLIDTGKPTETTAELVAWVKEREEDPRVKQALKDIGRCAERIRKGEDLRPVFRDHHRAQAALGIVPKTVAKMIAEIEHLGGGAKVIGAGGKTLLRSSGAPAGQAGGGGMVLAIHKNPNLLLPVVRRQKFHALPLALLRTSAGL
ncbi:MAG: hypothetical protein PHI23_04435 [Candidatus Peribacteraceae bacterium]|nr:hypothetical protein [Candidatus Peribacteraceae bacterium]